MSQGIRTIAGYTNSYPVVTTLSGTAKWNTTYILGEISSLNFTIPAYNVLDGTAEIRVYFTTSSAITSSIDTSNFTAVYGLEDVEFEANKSYELSFVPLTSTILTVTSLVNDTTVVVDLYNNGIINTDFYTDFISTLVYKTTYSFSKQSTYLQITSSSTSGGWIEPYTNTKIDLTDYDRIGVTFNANFASTTSGFLNGWLAVSSITPYTDSPWDASVNFFSPDIGTSAIGDYEGYLDVSALSGEYYILFNFGRGYSTLNDYIHVTHLWLEKG